MKILEPILTKVRPPGIYRLPSRAKAESILAPLAAVQWRGFYLDGHKIDTKSEFLRASAASMDFPTYFGQNWDAFEECIRDLSWAPAQGYVLLYDHVAPFATNQPDEWKVAHAILKNAVAEWRNLDKPFYVLLRNTGRYGVKVESLIIGK